MANHATSGAGGGPIDVPPVVELADPARRQLVDKKVACPFLGPLVVAGRLSVHQDASKPLAQNCVTFPNTPPTLVRSRWPIR